MTFEEALQEIGVAPGSSQEEIRRAYLRLVKTRKPETDPEGFRRLREAYELLRDLPEPLPGFFAASAPSAEPPAGPPATAAVSEIDTFLSGLEEELEAAPSSLERVARLREAVAEHPEDVQLCWWLAEELEGLELTDELEAFLRRCDQQGFPGFFEDLARRFPHSLGPEELARLEQIDDPAARICAAEVRFARGQVSHAVETVLQALQMAEERNLSPHPFPVLVLLLRLQARGHTADAARVRERLQSFLQASGQELARRGDWTTALWEIAQEMSRLSPEFPAPARAAIGEAIAAGAPPDAFPQLLRLVQEDGDVGWHMAAEIKELHFLGSLYHGVILDSLAKRSPPVTREPSSPWDASGIGRWIFGGFWVLFLLIRNCTPDVSRPPAYLPTPPGQSVPALTLGEPG